MAIFLLALWMGKLQLSGKKKVNRVWYAGRTDGKGGLEFWIRRLIAASWNFELVVHISEFPLAWVLCLFIHKAGFNHGHGWCREGFNWWTSISNCGRASSLTAGITAVDCELPFFTKCHPDALTKLRIGATRTQDQTMLGESSNLSLIEIDYLGTGPRKPL